MSAEDARAVLAAGWNPVPLPANSKEMALKGITGYRGRYLDASDIDAYDWSGNMALRLAPDVVGIDLDVYNGGDITLTELEMAYGKLPPAPYSTSRDDGSRIAYYRVPVGTTLRTKPGKGIEMIQFFHRYATCPPSTNPHNMGRPYRYFGDAKEPIDMLPNPGELPELPWGWIEGLGAIKGQVARSATAQEAADFIDAHTGSIWPRGLQGPFTKHGAATEGERHDAAITMTCWMAREAAAGWYPADVAFRRLEEWWDGSFDEVGSRQPDDGEFDRIVLHAIAQTTTPKGQAEITVLIEKGEALRAEEEATNALMRAATTESDGDEERNSFDPIDLRPYLDGSVVRVIADMLFMTDRRALLHRARLNGVHGDSGAGKSWLMAFLIRELIDAGDVVMIIDLEDTPDPLIERLRQIGVTDEAIYAQVVFMSPDEAFDSPNVKRLIGHVLGRSVTHVILDSLGEAFSLEGLNEDKDAEVTPWLRRVCRRIIERTHAGMTLIDHGTKSAERPLDPSGTKRKRAAFTGTSWLMQSVTPFTRAEGGTARLLNAKDRHGWFRRGDVVAALIMDPVNPISGQSPLRLEPATIEGTDNDPDMDVVVRVLVDAYPGSETSRGLDRAVRAICEMGHERVRKAVEQAKAKGLVVEMEGRNRSRVFTAVVPSTEPEEKT
jgi:hypothetical protein